MLGGFKDFLMKGQLMALAVGIIIGGAVGKVVSSLVADILMPVISLALPGGEWRTAKIVLSHATGPDGKEIINAINIGTFIGNVIDFAVIAFVVFMIAKAFLKEEPKIG
ncbi:MAG: large conductance mechanosensitive channel protein MscL [Bryobacteraceae bacterium]